jgi:hypothetical protein
MLGTQAGETIQPRGEGGEFLAQAQRQEILGATVPGVHGTQPRPGLENALLVERFGTKIAQALAEGFDSHGVMMLAACRTFPPLDPRYSGHPNESPASRCRFRPIDRKTATLLPPSVEDWLSEDHLPRFIVEAMEKLDLNALTRAYAGRGSAAYHPEVMSE